MEISWLGQSCFQIKGEKVTIVTDPFDPSIGLKLPKKLEANIVTVSHNHFDHNNIKAVSGNPFVIDGPGEYEVAGINIYGIKSFHDEQNGALRGPNTIYLIEAEDLKICHLGDLGHLLPDETVEELEDVDILMVPCGGIYTIDAEAAQKVINQIDPRIIIPMHYKIEGLNINLDPLDKFCHELGICKKPQDKLVIKKSRLPAEESEVIILNKK